MPKSAQAAHRAAHSAEPDVSDAVAATVAAALPDDQAAANEWAAVRQCDYEWMLSRHGLANDLVAYCEEAALVASDLSFALTSIAHAAGEDREWADSLCRMASMYAHLAMQDAERGHALARARRALIDAKETR